MVKFTMLSVYKKKLLAIKEENAIHNEKSKITENNPELIWPMIL